MEIRNLFAAVPASLPEELFEPLLSAPGVRVERILSRGHVSPPGFWYDQPEAETVLLLAGAAELAFDDPPRRLRLRPGDLLTIPAHCRHRVAWSDPETTTVWLALFHGEPSADG